MRFRHRIFQVELGDLAELLDRITGSYCTVTVHQPEVSGTPWTVIWKGPDSEYWPSEKFEPIPRNNPES